MKTDTRIHRLHETFSLLKLGKFLFFNTKIVKDSLLLKMIKMREKFHVCDKWQTFFKRKGN